MVDALTKAAENAKIAAPWHGWSAYRKAREAEDLMCRAERTVATVERFLQLAVPGNQ